jgi:uncharacterized protein YcfJ
MKTLITFFLLWSAVASHAQQAADVAMVIARQPRYLTTYQQQCSVQSVIQDNSQTDSTIGALAGAAIGSTIGGNNRDRLAGGVVGALIGGAIGNNVGHDSARAEARQVCRLVPVTVQQGETVTFSYQGRVFTQVIQ